MIQDSIEKTITDTIKNITEKGIGKTKGITSEDIQPWLEILKVLIWPFVAIVAILILRKSIINLLGRINKLGFAGIAAEATQQKQKSDDGLITEHQNKSSKGKNLDKTLGMFSDSTVEHFAKLVEEESQISDSKDQTERADTFKKYSQLLYVILSFERMYNTIFGSQLDILQRVNTTSNETHESLKRYYNTAEKMHPEFYATYPYDDYFKYLTYNGLIDINENNICSITAYGRDFLKFLVENGKSLEKSF